MTARQRRLVWGAIALTLAITSLAILLRPLRKEQPFHVPDEAEAKAAGELFTNALRDRSRTALAEQAGRFGLAAGQLDAIEGTSLAEPDDQCGGRGAYLFRSDPGALPVAVVAPHRGADRDTGPIARSLFEENRFASAAWNSAPRRGDQDCPYSRDITRLPTHYLTAYSLAFARRYPGGRIVQIHGFDSERRESAAGRSADAIVSDGSRQPSSRLLDVADCLSRAFPERRIAVFPGDADELGATSNAQGQALREAGFTGFVHLELSAPFRAHLVADAGARAAMARCLGTGL